MVFEYGVVVRPIIRNDHAPPPSLASVLIRGVEKVAVEEDSIAGIELAIDAIELPLRPLHPLGIGTALRSVAFSNGGKRVTAALKVTLSLTLFELVPNGYMVQTAHLVRSRQNS